jgi:yecA family protein
MQHLQDDLTAAEHLELFSFYPKHSEESYSLVSLDGFLHGIVCLPALINPTEWIQDVLPETPPIKAALERMLELTFRYYNQVVSTLQDWEANPRFDGSSEQARVWLEGFGRAFSYDTDALEALAAAEAEELESEDDSLIYSAIVMSHVLDSDDAPSKKDKEEFLRLKQGAVELLSKGSPEENKGLLFDLVISVYNFLEPAREIQRHAQKRKARYKQGKKMGRNEPCFCGSGKKFKHCHGRPGFEQ